MAAPPVPDSDQFALRSSRLPGDTVFYSLYPDSPADLQSLHLQVLSSVAPFTSSYIWQHQPFTLSISNRPLLHLRGSLRFGDNLDDEWFTVFLLFHISCQFPSLSIQVYDSDGEFLLIESAFQLPRWVNPENAENRIFIRRGKLHIIPRKLLPNPSLSESLKFLVENEKESLAPPAVESAIMKRIADYPERARRNIHQVRVRVPVSVAQVLKQEPCLISLAVEGFYDRDIDTMKHAAKMERFLGRGRQEELVTTSVKMSRAMYAQLVQQKFQAPMCYPMPSRSDGEAFLEAELGMKITCGLEMMYQQRKKEGEEGKGNTWSAFQENLERSGYFEGLIPGSKEYKRLMERAEEHYKKSSLFFRTSEMLNAPVKRIDEILALPHSADDFKSQEVPPSDGDSWLYGAEEELESALHERQREMEMYELKRKQKEKVKGHKGNGSSSHSKNDNPDLGEIVKNMQSFIHKVSTYEGAEVPEDRNFQEVQLDMERFMREMESVMKDQDCEDVGNMDGEQVSREMDLDESEDGSDISSADGSEDGTDISVEDEENIFMHSYSDAMNKELKNTTLKKSFISANESPVNKKAETSTAREDMDEELAPVDVDVNLVQNLLESFSSQQGLPGPTSNLLGLMGVQLPRDQDKSK